MTDEADQWLVLGVAPTRDPRAIKRAYAERLKAMDVEVDAAAFVRLRRALEIALHMARQSPAEAAVLAPPPLPPEAAREAEPHDAPVRAQVGMAGSELDPKRLSRLAGLLHGRDTSANSDAELADLCHALFSQLPRLRIDQAAQFEWWLAETLARTAPRSDALLPAAIATFHWDTREKEWRSHPAIRAVIKRQDDCKFRDALAAGRQPLSKPFLQLRRPPPDGFRWIGGAERQDMLRLLVSIETEHPSLVLDVDSQALAWWSGKVRTRGPLGQAWAKVAPVLPGGAAVWDKPRSAQRVRRRAPKGPVVDFRLILMGLVLVGAIFRGVASLDTAPPPSDTSFLSKCDWRGSANAPAGWLLSCPEPNGGRMTVTPPKGFGPKTLDAATTGDVAAMDAAAQAYADLPPPIQDRAKAVAYFRDAADQGYAPAMYHLGALNAAPGGVSGDGANRAEAVRWFRKAVDRGEPAAMVALAKEYQRGQVLPKDDAKAFDLYRRAADQGRADALSQLGLIYQFGAGAAKNDKLAVEMFRAAAARNDPTGETELALRYETAKGAPLSPKEAVRLFQAAMAQGDRLAEDNFALMEFDGRGVAANRPDAMRRLNAAAAVGDGGAMYALGRMLESGLGARKDDAGALNWYRRAAEAGYQPAVQAQQRLIHALHADAGQG